ncbi:acyl-CoA dehydrogenase family protein [Microbacterium sp. X-17]|uniref:acyl-CoA dehydrogenase family protein n=1 Tax=Microbacterium sp. X-17 TaxID=3144404 RepID=UPI0031F57775
MMTAPATITGINAYLDAAARCGGSVAPLLEALRTTPPGSLLPLPGSGRTAERFRGLARVAAVDVTAARVIEPHLDAVAILAEADAPEPEQGTTWGVFAAEAPGDALLACREQDRWVLRGRKPWCSLAGSLTSALVTASTPEGGRRMFAVSMGAPGVTAEAAQWVARGLAEVVSGPVAFDHSPARPVGGDGWYLDRPGFRWGAIGVAACWWGGCLPIVDALIARARKRPDDAILAARAGELYRRLDAGRLALDDAAARIDAHEVPDPAVLAHAVRGTVADAVAATLDAAREVLGPAALAFDEGLARRCADLELYVSQYHRGRDDASLAGHLAGGLLAW